MINPKPSLAFYKPSQRLRNETLRTVNSETKPSQRLKTLRTVNSNYSSSPFRRISSAQNLKLNLHNGQKLCERLTVIIHLHRSEGFHPFGRFDKGIL